ncbi:hypothetical protein REPUB_Repub20aG0037300 [Reevesia pubescens]
MDEAKRVFELMIEKDCAPDIFSYNIMINEYCKAKRLNKAIELFHEMSQKGSIPDVVTYNTLIQIMYQLGRLSAAQELFRNICASRQEHGSYLPKSSCYNVMIQGLFRNDYTSKAIKLLEEMVDKGFF